MRLPLATRRRCRVHDGATLGDPLEQTLGQPPEREVVDGDHHPRRHRVGHARVVEQCVHIAVDRGDRGVDGARFREVGLDEHVVRTGRSLDVQRRHVRHVELGQHLDQGRAHTRGSSGHDDAFAFVTKWIAHGDSKLLFGGEATWRTGSVAGPCCEPIARSFGRFSKRAVTCR